MISNRNLAPVTEVNLGWPSIDKSARSPCVAALPDYFGAGGSLISRPRQRLSDAPSCQFYTPPVGSTTSSELANAAFLDMLIMCLASGHSLNTAAACEAAPTAGLYSFSSWPSLFLPRVFTTDGLLVSKVFAIDAPFEELNFLRVQP